MSMGLIHLIIYGANRDKLHNFRSIRIKVMHELAKNLI